MSSHHRLPVSSRHAFALAFDLALRRDLLHSIILPLALQLPWVVLLLVAPPLDGGPVRLVLLVWLRAAAMHGIWFTGLLISAMLRYRARSVFNTPPERHPAPPSSCYRDGFRRVAALFCTEVLRVASFVVGGFLLFVPGLYLGFKFSMATEVIVLRGDQPDWLRETRALLLLLGIPVITVPLLTLVPSLMVPERLWVVWTIVGVLEGLTLLAERKAIFVSLLRRSVLPAFRRSFELTESRWERWLEMIVISVVLVVPIWFLMTVGALVTPSAWNAWFSLGTWLTQAALLVIQYAWTFFYLRLEESEDAAAASEAVVTPGAMGAIPLVRPGGSPRLRLVELGEDDDEAR